MKLKQTLSSILELLENQDRLWTDNDLARFFQCEKSKVYQIKSQPDFT